MEMDNKWIFSQRYSTDGITNKCSEKLGDVSTTFEGYGKARLRYRLCESQGNVQVYLDNESCTSVEECTSITDDATGIATVDFEFNPFTTLKIAEVGDAMVDIVSLDLGCRGNNLFEFKIIMTTTKILID